MKNQRILLFLAVSSLQIFSLSAVTHSGDLIALNGLKSALKNMPPNWVGEDPCADRWVGIECNNSRVTHIKLSSLGLAGKLPDDISSFSELMILDLSFNKDLGGPLPNSIENLKKLRYLILLGCSFSGRIPDSIGSLQQLTFISLISNKFAGPIPPSIGNLSNLFFLAVADNMLEGPIPVSDGNKPGLDMLINIGHFHFEKNKLSGTIPSKLFSSNLPSLVHVFFESNNLTGTIPASLGLVKSLLAVRLDRNSLTGHVPMSLNNLTNVTDLDLSNNDLTGPFPSLKGMNSLAHLDLSNNNFDPSTFPTWISNVKSLKTLTIKNAKLRGSVPSDLFRLLKLQKVVLSNNQFDGTLDIGTSKIEHLKLVDLQKNQISAFVGRSEQDKVDIILVNNPVCDEPGAAKTYCNFPRLTSSSSATPENHCVRVSCAADQIPSPKYCNCSNPYRGQIVFWAPPSSDHVYETFEQYLMDSFKSKKIPVDSVSISNPRKDSLNYLYVDLLVFPLGHDRFNRTSVSAIGFVLSGLDFKPPENAGAFYLIAASYNHLLEDEGSRKSNAGTTIGAKVRG